MLHGVQLDRNADRLLEQAARAEEQGDLDEAVKFLGQYVGFRPKDADALARFGLLVEKTARTPRQWFQAFQTLERVLRLDPKRADEAEIRRRLADLSMKLGQYKDALLHLRTLQTLTERTASADQRAELLSLQGQCRFGLGEYPLALRCYLAAIEQDEQQQDYYLQAAALLSARPEVLDDRDRLKRLSDIDKPRRLQLSEDLVNLLLPAETDGSTSNPDKQPQAEPADESHNQPDDPEPPEQPEQQQSGAQNENESDQPPLITTEERADRAIRALLTRMVERARPTHMAYVARAAFWQMRGSTEGVEQDVAEALSLAPDDPDVRLQAARWQLSKAQDAAVRGERAAAEAAVEAARSHAEVGLRHAPDNLSFYRVLADVELQVASYQTDPQAQQKHYGAAESHLRTALNDRLPDLLEAADHERQPMLEAEALEIRFGLADLLITRFESQTEEGRNQTDDGRTLLTEAEELIAELRSERARPALVDFLEARILVAQRNWYEASLKLVEARARLLDRLDLLKRIDLELDRCYLRLNNPDARLTVFRRAFKRDPLWIQGRLRLAQALVDENRIDKAIEEYQALWVNFRIKGIGVEIARLLMLREIAKPPDQRNWDDAERVLDAAESIDPKSVPLKVLRAEQLSLEGEFGLAEDELIAAAEMCENKADEVSVWVAKANLEARRTDKDAPSRYRNAQAILQEAIQKVGDDVGLRLAAVRLSLVQPPETARLSLAELESDLEKFSDADQARLLESLAAAYGQLGDRGKVRSLFRRVADLRPFDLAPKLVLAEAAHRDEDEKAFRAALNEIRRMEGPNGPNGNYLEASWLIARAAAQARKESQQASEAFQKDQDAKKLESTRKQIRRQLSEALQKPRELLRQAGKERPFWAAVPRRLGDLEALLDVRETAVGHYQRAFELGDRSRTALSYIVAYLYEKQRFAEADRLIKQISAERPQLISQQLAQLAAAVAMQLGERDRGFQFARTALAGIADETERQITAARLTFLEYRTLPAAERRATVGKKLLQSAKDQFRQALQKAAEQAKDETGEGSVAQADASPLNLWHRVADAWVVYVWELLRAGDSKAARAAIQQAADRLPAAPPELKPLTLARCYTLIRDNTKAEAEFRKAIEAAPDDVGLRIRMVEFYTALGTERFGDAQIHLEKILDPQTDAPRSAVQWARNRQALLNALGGTYEEGTEIIRRLEREKTETDDQRLRNLQTRAQILARRSTHRDRLTLIAVLERIDELRPLAPPDRFRLARLYEAVGNWEKAADILAQLNAENPNDPLVIGYYCQGLIREKKLDEAREWLARLEPLMPDSLAVAALKASLINADEELESETRSQRAAQVLLDYAASIDEAAPPEQTFRDLVLQDKAAEALKWLAQSVEPGSRAAQALQNGQDLLARGDNEAALDVLREHLWQLDFQALLATYQLRIVARLLSDLGLHADAETVFRRAMQTSTGRPDDILILIAYVARQGRIDDALDLCQQAWQNEAVSRVLLASTSVGIIRMGAADDVQMARVEAWLQSAIRQHPESVQIVAHLADLRDYQGRFDEAEKLYRAIIKQNGRNLMALNNLAWLLAVRGKAKSPEALDCINRAIAAAGPAGELVDTRGAVYLGRGQASEAVKDFQYAVDATGSAVKYFHLAQAYLAAGDQTKAKQAYQKALELGLTPDSLHPLEQKSYSEVSNRLASRR